MNKEALNKLYEKFSATTVLVVGDVMIDSYLWGKVDRISPEAPVPVVSITQKEQRLGGAANVALNLKTLGAEAIICSVIGKDSAGEEMLELLRNSGFTQEGIIQSENRPTTVKTRVISQGHHLLRIDEETTRTISSHDEQKLLHVIREIALREGADVIIFEDYNKGVLSEGLITSAIAFAKEQSIPTAVDPKKENFFAYKGVDLFKPNLKELKDGVKEDFEKKDLKALQHAIISMENRLNNRISLVTLSELGVVVKEGDSWHHIPAHVREILDVSGAGDTVISVAALALAAGCDAPTIAAMANLAGGLVCEKTGVVPVDKENLFREALKL
jgi:rfaE bifunctional protein kinase chain/domain